MKRLRRNGENWKVLTVDHVWPVWHRRVDSADYRTLPASNFEEARSAARRLVFDEVAQCCLLVAPSGMYAGMVSAPTVSLSTNWEPDNGTIEFIVAAYAVSLTSIYPHRGDPSEYEPGEAEAIDAAEKRLNKEWRDARRAERLPVQDDQAVSMIMSESPLFIPSCRAFTFVGTERRLHRVGRDYEAEPGVLAALYFTGDERKMHDGRMLGALRLEEPSRQGLCVLPDHVALAWWQALTGNAFRDMRFSPGFE